MSVLVCRDCGVDVAGEALFREVSFAVEPGEKVGLIGPNGAGKTTLIRACLGEHRWETGECFLSGTIGYLPQTPLLDDTGTVYEAMLESSADLLQMQAKLRELEQRMAEGAEQKIFDQYAALTEEFERQGGYALEARIRRILSGLGLEQETHAEIKWLSGGQKTRLALGKLLLGSPDLLFLDEPTNHLDIEALEWLEGFLRDYPGAVLMVSHDRYFLDQVVHKIVRLEQGSVKVYAGNYSEYELQRMVEEKTMAREAERTAKKIARLEEYVRRNRAGVNARQARGREIQLNKLTPLQAPASGKQIALSLGKAARSGDRVLEIEDLALSFGEEPLFQQVNLDLRRGDRIALLGKNGAGKTSLLKCILGRIRSEGRIRLGANVKIAYYSQEHEDLDLDKTVIDEIRYSSELLDAEVRSLLARFGFRGEEVFKPVRMLSGGEKSRLALCKLFLAEGNLLLLDEPTNHLDSETRAELEETLLDYEGTVLVISHDRYFLNRVVNKVAELTPHGLIAFEGNYSQYKEERREREKVQEAPIATPAQTERQNAKEAARQKKKLEQMEAEIAGLEKKVLELEQQMTESGSDYEKTLALHQEHEKMKKTLDEAMEAWAKAIEE